jgi:hypothetical protein
MTVNKEQNQFFMSGKYKFGSRLLVEGFHFQTLRITSTAPGVKAGGKVV